MDLTNDVHYFMKLQKMKFVWGEVKLKDSRDPKSTLLWRTCLFGLMLNVPVNSYHMVMSERSFHLTTHFPRQARKSSQPILHANTLACKWQKPFLNFKADEEIISWSISWNVWVQAGIYLATPGSAVKNVIDCAARPCMAFVKGTNIYVKHFFILHTSKQALWQTGNISSGFTLFAKIKTSSRKEVCHIT